MFRNKELVGRFEQVGEATAVLRDFLPEFSLTFLFWAFCILGQGCSSQHWGFFLWKAVEIGRTRNLTSEESAPQALSFFLSLFLSLALFRPSARRDSPHCLLPPTAHAVDWTTLAVLIEEL